MISERKIGEEFYDWNTHLIVVETSDVGQCINCFYYKGSDFGCANIHENISGECYDRLDKKFVAFQKVSTSKKQ